MTAKPGFASNRYAGIFSPDDYGVEPALRQGMAPQHSPESHQTTSRYSVSIDRFHCVLGAGRHIPARGKEHGRDCPLVSSEQEERNGFWKLRHPFFPNSLPQPSVWLKPAELCSARQPRAAVPRGPIFFSPATFELLQRPGRSRSPNQQIQV